MKPMALAGIVVAVIGALTLFQSGPGFGSPFDVRGASDASVVLVGRQAVPMWVGLFAMAAGIVMVRLGAKSARRIR